VVDQIGRFVLGWKELGYEKQLKARIVNRAKAFAAALGSACTISLRREPITASITLLSIFAEDQMRLRLPGFAGNHGARASNGARSRSAGNSLQAEDDRTGRQSSLRTQLQLQCALQRAGKIAWLLTSGAAALPVEA